jgi:hypothetical protein
MRQECCFAGSSPILRPFGLFSLKEKEMSIKVEVRSVEIDVKNGVSQKNGKPYSIREQSAWGFFVDQHGQPHPYPQRVRLTLDDEQVEPYPCGLYELADASFFPDRYGQIKIRAKLAPLPAAGAGKKDKPALAAVAA